MLAINSDDQAYGITSGPRRYRRRMGIVYGYDAIVMTNRGELIQNPELMTAALQPNCHQS
jgi:hypothetical protein